jgi:hypothetical protein
MAHVWTGHCIPLEPLPITLLNNYSHRPRRTRNVPSQRVPFDQTRERPGGFRKIDVTAKCSANRRGSSLSAWTIGVADHPESDQTSQYKRVYRYLCGETSYKPSCGPRGDERPKILTRANDDVLYIHLSEIARQSQRIHRRTRDGGRCVVGNFVVLDCRPYFPKALSRNRRTARMPSCPARECSRGCGSAQRAKRRILIKFIAVRRARLWLDRLSNQISNRGLKLSSVRKDTLEELIVCTLH